MWHIGLTGKTKESMKRSYAGELRLDDVGKEVEIAGWVHKRRDFGDLIFVDMRDRSGLCHVVFDVNLSANTETIAASKSLRQ